MPRRMIAFFLLLALAAPLRPEKKVRPLLDIAMISAVTVVYVLAIDDTRQRIFREASIEKVWENIIDPVQSAVQGGKMDHNSFWINYVGHPLSFACLGLYLKERGYSNGGALLFSQTVNVIWEYAIEGSLWKPSAKDLVTDLCGSLAAIFVLAPLSDLGEKRIAAGDRKLGNYFLYYLNPFKKINRLVFGRQRQTAGIFFMPSRGGFTAGLRIEW